MALPNPGLAVSPFDTITAQYENEQNANIEALAAGTGLDDGAVTTAKIDDGAVTSSKIAFTTYVELGRATASGSTTSVSVSISAYKHLRVLIGGAVNTGNTNIGLRLNGITSGYTRGVIVADSSGVSRTTSTTDRIAVWASSNSNLSFYGTIDLQGKPVAGKPNLAIIAGGNLDNTRTGIMSIPSAQDITSISLVADSNLLAGSELVVFGFN